MIKVSVIVPIYNKQKYLPQCLRSVLQQSLKELEVICINDGSTDRSLSILKHYASKDHRVRIMNQKNAGAGAARNRGIERASGEYLMFMDADDYYPAADIIEELYMTAKRKNALICGGSFSECHTDGSIRTHWTGPLADYTFDANRFWSFGEYQFDYGFHRFLYSAELIKSNQICYPDYAWYEDPPFMVQAMLKAGRFYAVQKITYRYRFEYQKQKWDVGKVNDLVRGISYNMKTASENQLSKLLYINYKRMTEEYFDTIRNCMTPDNIELLCLLICADNHIDSRLLMQEMPDRDPRIQKMPLYTFFIKDDFRNAAAVSAFIRHRIRNTVGRLYHSKCSSRIRMLLRKALEKKEGEAG